jgi:mRNA interferase MazF
LVIQNDIGNHYSPITIVAAISSKFGEPPYPTEVVMEPAESGLSLPSAVVLNQIRSVDRQRLGTRLGRAGPKTMDRVDKAIQISLGLIKI